jgi:hypothetical protein
VVARERGGEKRRKRGDDFLEGNGTESTATTPAGTKHTSLQYIPSLVEAREEKGVLLRKRKTKRRGFSPSTTESGIC